MLLMFAAAFTLAQVYWLLVLLIAFGGGWGIYEAHVARDIGTSCAPGTPGFAEALAHWQENHHLPASGEANVQTLVIMQTTGHRSVETLRRYYRSRDPLRECAGAQIDL